MILKSLYSVGEKIFSFNKKTKVVVIGNCQARPIAKILSLLNKNIEVTSVAIVHLLKSEEASSYLPLFEDADLIITQLIADNYPCDFVRTSALKKAYNEKIIAIVNLYYSGYSPDLMYIRDSSQGTLKSPLGEYHSKTILESYKEGLSVEETITRYNDIEYNKNHYFGIAAQSLEELKSRELLVDIKITDLIEENLSKERLFFIFNHPSMSLLVQMTIRILEEAKIKINNLENLKSYKEPLDKIIVPVNVYAKKLLNIEFKNIDYFKGVECSVETNGGGKSMITIGESKNYTLEEIVKKYYEVYGNVFK